jgi:hypothetical protein
MNMSHWHPTIFTSPIRTKTIRRHQTSNYQVTIKVMTAFELLMCSSFPSLSSLSTLKDPAAASTSLFVWIHRYTNKRAAYVELIIAYHSQ